MPSDLKLAGLGLFTTFVLVLTAAAQTTSQPSASSSGMAGTNQPALDPNAKPTTEEAAPTPRAAEGCTTAAFKLQGLDDAANYAVEDADTRTVSEHSGRSLREQGLELEMAAPKQSRLMFYQREK